VTILHPADYKENKPASKTQMCVRRCSSTLVYVILGDR
jgi:hypothetical protein